MADAAHVIRTGRNGQLDGTTPDDVRRILTAISSAPDVVIHLHGGLVDEASGLRIAKNLNNTYLQAGAYPVFMVWQSGLLEVLRHNLDEIAREELFKRLLKRVLQFAVGKLQQGQGERAAGVLPVPNDRVVTDQLAERQGGSEPFGDMRPQPEVTELSQAEREQLETTVAGDDEVRTALDEVLASRHPEAATEGARGVVVATKASGASLIDPEALEEIDAGVSTGGERGLLSTAALARKCGRILVRVIGRFRGRTDHGVYPTVLEELLREFYLANAGGSVWAAMKKETLDGFAAADPPRGARLLLDGLASTLSADGRPRITLVGHSTGAVYIDHLLTEIERGNREGDRPWPEQAQVRVVFLAPACTYKHFVDALDRAESLIREFRMFTMNDEAERSDRLVGPFYPRSLLYFVSGVLERTNNGASALAPIVGMARYRDEVYDGVKDLARGRRYLIDERVVLSPTGDGAQAGRRAGALSHGSFDEDPLVRESLATLIAGP